MWWQTVWIYEIYAEQTIADAGEMISKYNNAVKNYTSIFPVTLSIPVKMCKLKVLQYKCRPVLRKRKSVFIKLTLCMLTLAAAYNNQHQQNRL